MILLKAFLQQPKSETRAVIVAAHHSHEQAFG